jgi:hypothetical protein
MQYNQFTFNYGNGDSYQGQVYTDDGLYTQGQTLAVLDENGQTGTYTIDSVLSGDYPVDYKDKVYVFSYYDAETQQSFTPDGYYNGGANNGVSGLAGLGSEHDTIQGNAALGAFGFNPDGNHLEADVAPPPPRASLDCRRCQRGGRRRRGVHRHPERGARHSANG